MSLELVFGPNKSIITTPHTFKKFNKDITIPSLNPNTNVPSSIFMNDKNYIYEEIEQIFEYLREPFYPSNELKKLLKKYEVSPIHTEREKTSIKDLPLENISYNMNPTQLSVKMTDYRGTQATFVIRKEYVGWLTHINMIGCKSYVIKRIRIESGARTLQEYIQTDIIILNKELNLYDATSIPIVQFSKSKEEEIFINIEFRSDIDVVEDMNIICHFSPVMNRKDVIYENVAFRGESIPIYHKKIPLYCLSKLYVTAVSKNGLTSPLSNITLTMNGIKFMDYDSEYLRSIMKSDECFQYYSIPLIVKDSEETDSIVISCTENQPNKDNETIIYVLHEYKYYSSL